MINFINKILENDNYINTSLLKEESNIIIFCNKLYFSHFNKKSKRNLFSLKNNTKTITNKNFFYFGKFNIKFQKILNKNTSNIENFSSEFNKKYTKHSNCQFEIEKRTNNIITKLTTKIYATLTRNPKPNSENGWNLGILKDNSIQYVNKDHIAHSNDLSSGNNFKESTIQKDLERKEEMINLFKNNPKNVDKIETDLSDLVNNKNKFDFNSFYERCIHFKSTTSNCMEIYKIKYGEYTSTFVEIFINIKK